ncbi:hypothetical protein MMC25_007117 [Agyrium rufum]|nr:hypothetical protein [Agyrium rufum]
MPKDEQPYARKHSSNGNLEYSKSEEEAEFLLARAQHTEDEEEEEGPILDLPSSTSSNSTKRPSPGDRRHSSLARSPQNGAPRTPRTANRVRFDVDDRSSDEGANGDIDGRRTGNRNTMDWMEEEDYMSYSNSNGRRGRGRTGRPGNGHQRAPLLTEIEAPSVTVANSEVVFRAEDLLESARPKSGMSSAFMNMANSIIGAGIIGQPYAFRQAGLLTGVLLLVGLTFTVDWTIRLIVINSKLSGANSFQATVQHCFGKRGLIAISVAQWAFAFGGMLAFCIIIGDSIPHVLLAIWPSLPKIPVLSLLADRRTIIVIFVLGISFPLSLYRDIAKLAKASTFALISMFVILMTVVIQGARIPSEDRGSAKGLLLINGGVFQAIGVISFAFVCHHNSLLIYGSLKKPTIDRFSTVTHFSAFVSMVACLIMALAGFLTFGDKTVGNVLNNFSSDNVMVNIARLCFGLNMLTTLPLEAFVCREVMENYWYPNEEWNRNRHLLFTTALVLSAVLLSLLTCDLGAVFELIGATSACALAYILPPLCYIKLTRRSWKTVAAAVCAVFGVCVMIISVVQALAKIIRSE